jgi:hypothetical protein
MQYYKLERELKKTQLTGRSPLRKLRSTLDHNVTEGEGGGGGGEEEEAAAAAALND